MADWSQVAEAFSRYLMTSGKEANTARTYTASISIFWRWCHTHETDPARADKMALRTWLDERRRAVRRAHADLAALRLFYAYWRELGVRDDDPCEGLKTKRLKTVPTEPLDTCDVRSLFDACTNDRDRIIILMSVKMGLRIAELASVQAEMIDWQSGELNIMGKGSKERPLVIPADVLYRLRAYLGLFPSGAIFRSLRRHAPMSGHQIRKVVYRIAEHAGMGGVHPHRFRATFACSFIEQHDGDLHALKGAMRHKDVSTTQRYTQAVEIRRGLQKMSTLRFAI